MLLKFKKIHDEKHHKRMRRTDIKQIFLLAIFKIKLIYVRYFERENYCKELYRKVQLKTGYLNSVPFSCIYVKQSRCFYAAYKTHNNTGFRIE